MKYIRLRSFYNGIEASLAKDKLENNGIPCFLTNESITTLLPTLNFIHGGGVQLMVSEDDYMRADEMLKDSMGEDSGNDVT